MKSKIFRMIMATTMVTTMLLGTLTGCTAKDGGTEASGSTSDSADRPDTWIADRTITIQAYVDDIGYSLPEDFSETPVGQEIKRLTGIDVEVQYTPGAKDSEVLASQLAAGTIPDVVVTYLNNSSRPEFTLLLKAAKEGLFADVSEYMKESKVYSKYYEEGYLPNDTYKNITFRDDLDGAYIMQLSIPAVDRSLEFNPQEEYVGGMYIQKSIVEALGINPAAIRTQEQFYDLLVDIKNGGFKDKNGNDVYPLGPKYWGGSKDTLDYIVRGYNWGVSDGYNIDQDGNIKHEVETDYVYKKIDFVRKLLAEDLMNPEFFTMDSTRAAEVSEIGNSAIIADVHNYQEIVYETGEWVPLGPLNDYTGDNAKVVNGKSGYGAWAISSEAENPEEIFAFFDFLSTREGKLLGNYGIEGEHYDMVDGKPVVKPEILEHINNGDSEWLINNVGASFGGTGVVLWEFIMTDIDWLEEFGESRPGAGSGGGFEGAIEIATKYPYKEKLIPGLDATAYLSADSLMEVKAQMSLLDYDEMLVQAMYAASEKEVKDIVEGFRKQIQQAGLEEFRAYLEEIYKEDSSSLNFYPIN
ncbi:extracellular solute-binding protein [Zhenhengia yiwuensis]|uniref:Extracellular solute-binding protein n=1 Tax=Zhenhengia yiwuensis TaxID=2763666 RepID=A0A926IF35_9FIRM|nr:extracellular solute-binding protein [Zhenhengia yiwuensis]MBC8580448.1 extracellular solute-binding protein [Zhenhengia yiwuensis]